MSAFPGFPAGPAPGLPQTPDPAAGGMSPQVKAMIAQALMGNMGAGGMGGPQNSFAGGLASGVNPMLQAMMRQRLMTQMMPQGGGAAPMAPGMPMGGAPAGNIG